MKLIYQNFGLGFASIVIFGLFQISVYAEDSNGLIEATGTTSLLHQLSSDELESLRNDLKITTDPACREALQESLVNFLKRIRDSNGIRVPRQDDGDDGDGDGDGDGGGGGGGGILGGGGAGGLLNGVDLPPVVPQVLGALTQAFTGLNQVVNASSGQASIPSLLFNGFANIVGQFTGQTPAPVTPPPYYPIPPGGFPSSQLRPPAPPGGYPNNRTPPGPGQQQRPLGPRPSGPGQQPWAPVGSQQQFIPGQPRPPPRTRSPSRRPRPTGPPKSSLWNIYKSFSPAAGTGSLTDFQIAHPEGFHSELLQSISSSFSKNRGPSERPSNSNSNSGQNNNNNNNEPSSDISQSQYPNFQQPQRPRPPPRVPEPEQEVLTSPRPSILAQLQQRPSVKPSFLIQKIITAPITLSPEILSAVPTDPPTEPPVVLETTSQTLLEEESAPTGKEPSQAVLEHGSTGDINKIFAPDNADTNSNSEPQYLVTNSPEPDLQEGTNPEDEVPGNPGNIFNSNNFQGSFGNNEFPSSAGNSFQGQTLQQQEDAFQSQSQQFQVVATSSPEPIRTPPPVHESHLQQEVRPTQAPEEEEPSKPEKLMNNRLSGWVLGKPVNPLGSENQQESSPSKNKRPVIINNMFYPDLETALATGKPRRRRRTTTTQAPALESDYYEEEEDPASQSKSETAVNTRTQ